MTMPTVPVSQSSTSSRVAVSMRPGSPRPSQDGREVLAELKADDALRKIPVVVLTTSEAEEDVVRSYSLHANAYVTKPVDFERFVDVVRQIDDFFVSVVRLPNKVGLAGNGTQ